MKIHRAVIPQHLIEDALRAINTHIFTHGLTRQDCLTYAKTACWLPGVAMEHPAIRAIRDAALQQVPCPPDAEVWTQIILQFPDPDGQPREPEYHRDNPPADGRVFTGIIGIPLTPSSWKHGGVSFPDEQTPHLRPGDLIHFDPNQPHTGGTNTTGLIRYCLYIRFVETAAKEAA